MCCNMQPFLKVINVLFTLVMISIPIILIVLGTVDMFKAITANDDKQIKEARGSLIKRVIYAVLIFLVPFIVRLVLQFTEEVFLTNDNSGLDSPTSWVSCWNSTMNGTINCSSCQDIYEEDESNNNPNQGDTGSEDGTKMCYWWKMAVCDKTEVLTSNLVDQNALSQYSLISGPDFENNQAYCKYKITPDPGNNYCSYTACQYIGGTPDPNNSCICTFSAALRDDYNETEPRIAFNGQVTVYQIDSNSSCSNAPNHFSPVGTISVPKQTN